MLKHNLRRLTKLTCQSVFTVVVVLPLFPAAVHACQCREREPPCAQYGNADVVFVGSVIQSTVLGFGPQRKIVFSIERAIKGLSGSTAELMNSGTSCNYEFALGKTYLVYAYRNPKRNELYSHYCTRTTELANAKSDFAFFALTAEKSQLPRILGVLADNAKRLRDVSVVASSGGKDYRTTTDNEGWFNLEVPRPSKYRVRISLPLYAAVAGTSAELAQISQYKRLRTRIIIEYEVIVEADKCAFINPPLFIDYFEYQKHRRR